MPRIESDDPAENPIDTPSLRLLSTLAKGGALTLGRLGARAGLAGSAATRLLRNLASAGLVEDRIIDVDGLKESTWRITEAGENVVLGQSDAVPDLKARRDVKGKQKLAIGALVPLFGQFRIGGPWVGEALDGCSWVGIPFMGSLAELPYIGARTILCNDLHCALVNLAMVAADHRLGPKLWRHLRRLPFHPMVLEQAQQFCIEREAVGGLSDKPDLTWAQAYFVSAWMSRNGESGKAKEYGAALATRWTAGGGDSAVRFRNAAIGLRAWRKLLGKASFECTDAFEFLKKCKDVKGHGIYCDPPFPGPGDAYKHKFPEASQRKLATVLTSYGQARVVCRFYDVPLIRSLYREKDGWRWLKFAGRKQNNDKAPEVLIARN